MRHDGWPLPESDFFVLRETKSVGRAIFARKSLHPGTHLLSTTDGLEQASSPTAHVILRPYRREVCAQCFAYDRGREWKIRLLDAGVVFCSDCCRQRWEYQVGEVGCAAHRAVEATIKQQQQQRRQGNKEPGETQLGESVGGNDHGPGIDGHVTAAWQAAGRIGRQISIARTSSKPSKSQKRVLRSAAEASADPDILAYLLSGVSSLFIRCTDGVVLETFDTDTDASVVPGTQLVSHLLPEMMMLAGDPTVYATNSSLPEYIRAYHTLLAVLPLPLLPFLQPALCHELASRASHNAFSIRPAGASDGEQSGEFMGWGIWPEASFFNHSCRPNVKKERRGRRWTFHVSDEISGSHIAAGEELCITYLGGDEKDLGVTARRKKLQDEWGFYCQCTRCREESGQGATPATPQSEP